MMAYPLEKDKGRSFALFWCLFQVSCDRLQKNPELMGTVWYARWSGHRPWYSAQFHPSDCRNGGLCRLCHHHAHSNRDLMAHPSSP